MGNKNFLQLPAVETAFATDVIAAVQGNVPFATTVQQTLGQVAALFLNLNVLTYPGNPNNNISGVFGQFCIDTLNLKVFICTTTGTSTSAIWTLVSDNAGGIVSPTEGGTGVSNPIAHSLPVAEGSSNFNFLGPLTNGQILIGSTGLDPVPGTITAGTNITITNTPGGITISASGDAGFSWNNITSTSANITVNSGFVANNSSLVTLTLPVISPFGSRIGVIGIGTGGFRISQNAGQNIISGTNSTTVGVTGYLTGVQYDSFELVTTSANTTWTTWNAPQSSGLITF